MPPSASQPDRAWFIVSRWQEYRGEATASLLRVAALAAFYGAQLYRFLVLDEPSEAAASFHRQATLISAAWLLVLLAVLILLRRGALPSVLKYLSTAADIVLLTLLARAGEGSASPLIYVYFLILVLAALRGSLRLIWCATLGCLIAYMSLVGDADERWFDAEHATPVLDQLITLISLILAGVMLGQVIRQQRPMALEYHERATASKEGT